MRKYVNTAIIGLGPQGITTSYYCKQQNIDHIVLESTNKIASSWELKVWDDITLGMELAEINFPELHLSGFSPNHLLNRTEIVDLCTRLVTKHKLPVLYNCEVTRVTQNEEHPYIIQTSRGIIFAKILIVCIGPRHTPKFPEYVSNIPKEMVMHSSAYRNPHFLSKPQSEVLIVGSGLASLNIADNIMQKSQHRVSLGCGYHDNIIKNNNQRFFLKNNSLFTQVLPSKLMAKGIINFGKLINATSSELIFESQRVQLSEFDMIIFATGYNQSFPFLQELLPSSFCEKGQSQLNALKKLPGLYILGEDPSTSLSDGTLLAQKTVQDICEKYLIKDETKLQIQSML